VERERKKLYYIWHNDLEQPKEENFFALLGRLAGVVVGREWE